MSDSYAERGREHVLSELGFSISRSGDALEGTADVLPQLHVPGTDLLRTSVLAIWVDVITGISFIDVFDGRVPVTLDLMVDVVGALPSSGSVTALSRPLKVGRSVAVAEVEFRATGSEDCFALGSASFVAVPDPSLTLPSQAAHLSGMGPRSPVLTRPLADRAGVVRGARGSASVARRDDGMNASNTINGGIIALVLEEAALSGSPEGTTLSSVAVRYLRAGRTGPVIAQATPHGRHLRTEARDAGADDRLLAVAMSRTAER